MEGYEVITSDQSKAGQVTRVEGDMLIVESGHLRKSQHAVPLAFAHAEDDERAVRLTVSKEIVDQSPKLENGDLDRQAIAAHYGLAEGFDEPETEGYGETVADDPAWGSEIEGRQVGVQPAAEERAQIREGEIDPGVRGRPLIPPDTDS
jgi:hypothetical protein